MVFGLDEYKPAIGTGGAGSTSSASTGPTSCCVTVPGLPLVEVTEAAGDAPPPQPCPAPVRLSGGAPPTDTCDGCTCDATSVTCAASVDCYQDSACAQLSVTLDLGAPVGCAATNGILGAKSCKFSSAAHATSSAAPGGGTLSPGQWEKQYALCPVDGAPDGCDTGASCPQHGAGTRLCLLAPAGTTSCPAGFDDLSKVYDGGEDNQACNCTCDTTCGFDVKLGGVLCDVLGSTTIDPAQCTSVANGLSYGATPKPAATAHSGVSGTFAPSPPKILCCQKGP